MELHVIGKLPLYMVLICLGCLLHCAVYAVETVDEYDQKLETQKKKIERVLEGIDDHSTKVVKSEKQERSLLEQLENLENQIAEQEKKLLDLQHDVEVQDQLTQKKQQEMEEVEEQKNLLREHTENRIAAYYRTGDIGLLNVMFSASSIPELISFRESYHLMLKHDQLTIRSYRDKIEEHQYHNQI